MSYCVCPRFPSRGPPPVRGVLEVMGVRDSEVKDAPVLSGAKTYACRARDSLASFSGDMLSMTQPYEDQVEA